jgi:Xaa-Pro dipeptidase
MATSVTSNPRLSLDRCRQRQARLRVILQAERLDAALITDPRHVHYLSGYWRCGRVLSPVALLVRMDGGSTLAAPSASEAALAADDVCLYEASLAGTIIDDPDAALFDLLRPRLSGLNALGLDRPPSAWSLEVAQLRPLSAEIRGLRRAKDPDEVAMLQVGIAGCDAAFARAKELKDADVTEVELYAAMLSAATVAVREPLTEFGNDFQCGALGSVPRDRRLEAGDTAILDVGVVYRGYSSDLCRTFVVGRQPNEAQIAAHARIMEAMRYVEEAVRPGVSCLAVYREVHAMLDGYRGCVFEHHLGHGIGLSAHEAPRLNPHWDDTFEVGDVFTAEPGLYGDNLRAGIRVENDYLVTATGLERLSHFPSDLT